MNRGALTVFAVILGVAALVAYLTLFTVSQTQQALVLEFGKPKRVITDPGLQYKIPFIQNVEFFDKRILDIDTASQEVIASDKKRLVVDAFARYRINDPLKFYQTVGSISGANAQLSTLLTSALRRVLGEATFIQVVRDERPQLTQKVREQLDREAQGFGMDVIDAEILGRAEERVHGALAVGRHQDVGACRRGPALRGRSVEGDAGGTDVVDEDAAQRVVPHLADERCARPEARHADDRVRRRATGNLDGRTHRFVDALGLLLDDERHRALANGVTHEEVVIGAGDHVDDRVADAEDVETGLGHEVSLGREGAAL